MANGRLGPPPQTVKREWFAALIAQGVGNAEACRMVGINRRTGKRWRHGRTVTSSSALALTAASQAWAQHAGTPVPELTRTTIR
jgi:hypothetical protein